jgi:hypothetical protein
MTKVATKCAAWGAGTGSTVAVVAGAAPVDLPFDSLHGSELLRVRRSASRFSLLSKFEYRRIIIGALSKWYDRCSIDKNDGFIMRVCTSSGTRAEAVKSILLPFLLD